jgi:ABC-type multidrug transport system ATPase subunit
MNESLLQWVNMTIATKNNRIILNDVSGEINGGQSLAIMGSSGAGKTTLLNTLSKKSNLDGIKKISGEVNFILNGINQKRSFTKLSGYVTQDDVIYETLTPREMFLFAAHMSYPKKNYEEKTELVNSLISRLGLEKCADTLVGDTFVKGLSGGEKKRTAIGYELMIDPIVLFLDEPTTGLDSTSAFNIIKLITDEAKISNKIIIFTIHQPNSEIVTLFDKLLLLAEGKVAYQGDSKLCINYFSELGYKCPNNFNPAEYYIRILSKEAKIVDTLNLSESWQKIKEKKRTGSIKSISKENFDSSLTSSDPAKEREKELSHSNPNLNELSNNDEKYEKLIETFNNKAKQNIQLTDIYNYEINNNKIKKEQISVIREFGYLFQRNFLVMRRDLKTKVFRIMLTVINVVLTLMVYFDIQKGNDSVQMFKGLLFFITAGVAQTNLQSTLVIFTFEKAKFYKDQRNGLYGVITYFLSKTVLEIPITLISAILIFFIEYFFTGLSRDNFDKYLIFIITIFLTGYAGTSFAIFISSLIDTRELIPVIFPFFILTQVMCSGYFVTEDNIPYIFYPFKYISIFRYCYQSLCWNEFEGKDPVKDYDCIGEKCTLPTGDGNFSEGLTLSLILLVVVAMFNNIISILALKLKVWLLKRNSK